MNKTSAAPDTKIQNKILLEWEGTLYSFFSLCFWIDLYYSPDTLHFMDFDSFVILSESYTPSWLSTCLSILMLSRPFFFFFKDFIYLFMRHRERGRDTGGGRSRLPAGSPTWDSILGPWGHAMDRRQTLHPRAPQAPLFRTLSYENFPRMSF